MGSAATMASLSKGDVVTGLVAPKINMGTFTTLVLPSCVAAVDPATAGIGVEVPRVVGVDVHLGRAEVHTGDASVLIAEDASDKDGEGSGFKQSFFAGV